jgi:cytochrome c553
MALRIPVVASLALLALGASFAANAQVPIITGDAKRGQPLAYTCNGCHAIPNYKNVYPTYSVPKLRGQRPEYLVAALKAYKSGERSHGTMHSQAVSMNEQDMADVAVYLAGNDVLTKSVSDVPATARPKATEICLACHGTNGVGITADYPTISGQHRDYLERSLTDYKKGGRKNAIMAGMAASLTAEDIEQLAAYYSGQKPALETLKVRNYTYTGVTSK